jgi:Flp pilus assembly protein TadG
MMTRIYAYRACRAASRLRRSLVRVAGDSSGVAAIEVALFAPVLMLMTVSVTDIGMGIYRKMQVENAAQVGAQYAIRNGFDADAIAAAVTSATNFSAITASPAPIKFCGCATVSGISNISCGATCPGGASAGTYTTVSAQATYKTIINYQIASDTYSFSNQSTVRLQ